MKFWIGGAAEIANMSIIWAQLILDGISFGPHPFIVQIREHKTHRVLPGITIGDCGPKIGINYLDNGYLIFDNIKIPKDNLLGKLGKIDENGRYVSDIKNSDARFGLHMSPLSSGRGIITLTANAPSINALTIALRYACGRKQFDNHKKTD
jgi:acyl-CoA oxidase